MQFLFTFLIRASGGPLELSWSPLGSRGLFFLSFGLPRARLGSTFGRSGPTLGLIWEPLGATGPTFGAHWALLGRLGASLGGLWHPLGATLVSLGLSGVSLGRSLVPLGLLLISFGVSEALWGPLWWLWVSFLHGFVGAPMERL